MTNLRTGINFAALSLSVAAMASPVFGQEGRGREGVLSFSQGFEYDLDTGLDTTTDVGLNILTSTRSEKFSFGLGTQLFGDFTDAGSDDFQFRNWFASLGYERQGANSLLAFSADYREVELGDETFELAPGLFIFGEDGSLATTRFGARIETGIEGPFGLTLDANYRDEDYSNTVDPDLVDEVNTSLDALARFSLSPSMSLRALAGIEKIEESDATNTERENTYVGLGVGGETAGGLSFSADILYDQTEVVTSLPSTTSDDGIGIELAVTQDRRNGSIGASLSSRIDDVGRRTAVMVNRSLDLRNGGLDVSLGAVDQEGESNLQVVGGFAYSAETPRGEVSANLSQSAGSSDGDTVISTSLELAYSEAINASSGWEAELGYVATNELAGDDDNRTTASIAYVRDLTADWSMRTGYEYSRDNGGDASNSVFFNIERDITFGF